jgi:hypothetical protein
MERYLAADRMIGVVRNHLGRYFKHLPGSSEIRGAVYQSPSVAALNQMLLGLREKAALREQATRPPSYC